MSEVMEACGKKKEVKEGGKENERGNVKKTRVVKGKDGVKGKRKAKVVVKRKGKQEIKVVKKGKTMEKKETKKVEKKTEETTTTTTRKRKRPTEAEVMANLPKRSKIEYPKELKNASQSRKEKWRIEQVAKKTEIN